MTQNPSSLQLFHPLIRAWFTEKFTAPTDVQDNSWRAIGAGRHVLLTAPTGSGKTLAAFLWAINQLATGTWLGGTVRVLYVSPMKALNNDVHRNLERPLAEIGERFRAAGLAMPTIHVQSRSGDTGGTDRQRMYRKPPEILVTTPESLNILVTSKSGRAMLGGVAAVILDEIHAVLPEKRGTHLICAVDRLVRLSGEFQRIALSATVRPLATVADFVGGAIIRPGGGYDKRPVTIIRSTIAKEMSVVVTMPPEAETTVGDGSWWPAMVEAFKKIIADSRSTLFFTNSRRHAEKVTRLLNENEEEELAYPHHGSLARELRLAVEQKLKSGELQAIVATNSLELGIDIGDLDQVVLVQSPPSVAQTIQRVGRAGHQVGKASRGLLFPLHGKDFIHAAVLAKAVREKDIEEIRPVDCPFDVLAQIILAMTIAEKWLIDELFDNLRASYPYRHLSRTAFDAVLAMLAGRYADSKIRELRSRVHLDLLAGTVEAKDGVAYLLYTSGGTIPDRGAFLMRHQENKTPLGELDEEFVWERRLGETFALGAQVWRIQAITHNDVEVIPVAAAHNIIPFWKGEGRNRDWHLSELIGLFLEECNDALSDPTSADLLSKRFMADYAMDEVAAKYLHSYLELQRQTSRADLPHRHHLLIEHFNDPQNTSDSKQVILHTLWGGRINHPFALALAATWKEKHSYPLTVFADNDCILLMLPHAFDSKDLLTLVNSGTVDRLLRLQLEESGFFGALFRENCGRALLLPKTSLKRRMPLWLNRLRAKKLLEAVLVYEDFPILLETWRECFHDRFDLPNLKMLLDELEAGQIAVSEIVTHHPSPFADGVVWNQTNKFMYEDDTPDGGKQSSLSDSLIRELVFSAHLRPKILPEIIALFLGKIGRTAPGYGPLQVADLIEAVEERLFLSEEEWQELLAASVRDGDLTKEELLSGCCKRLVALHLPGAAAAGYVAIVKLPFIALAFGLSRENLTVSPICNKQGLKIHPIVDLAFALPRDNQGDEIPGPAAFLTAWLATRGPIALTAPGQLLGFKAELLEAILAELAESRQIVVDTFTAGKEVQEVCDASSLEILLRMQRRARQPVFEPLGGEILPLFLATHQGLTGNDGGLDALQHGLDTLFGYPAPCAAWEEYLLPARVTAYQKNHLDSLLLDTGLIWYGCGPKKTAFAFPQDLELFVETRTEEDEETCRLFAGETSRSSFFDLQNRSGLDSGTLTSRLWQLIWRGRVAGDNYNLLRKGIETDFTPIRIDDGRIGRGRRTGLSRWESSRPLAGNYALLKQPEHGDDDDPIRAQELDKDRVRQLLVRYGIVFRDLLAKESLPLQWRSIYKTLRLMELSGEILSGYFFEEFSGPQFLAPETFRRLQKGFDQDAIFWLNACDPASLCGLGPEGIKKNLPKRLATTYLVYHGEKLVLILKKNGREMEFLEPAGHPLIPHYLEICKVLLTRDFNPLKMIVVDHINGNSPARSEYLTNLRDFGFTTSHRGLVLHKKW
ncbi:MAG: DEAD/DEAH box helicase [Pseudomonadota bacterium]